jgi:hypothetical protein
MLAHYAATKMQELAMLVMINTIQEAGWLDESKISLKSPNVFLCFARGEHDYNVKSTQKNH